MAAKPVVLTRIRGRAVRLWGLYVGSWQAASVWATTRRIALRQGRSRRATPQIPDDWRPRLRAKLEVRADG